MPALPRARRLAAAALAALALLLAGGAPAPPAEASGSPSAVAACRTATIGGHRRCIAPGQFCARRYERDYRRYGYTCAKRDRNGRYHLRRR
jgi:uncharacterized membrane protein